MKLFLFVFTFLLLNPLKAHVLYDGLSFEKGNYLFESQTDYFQTSSTFDSNGNQYTLTGDEAYSEINSSLLLKYAYSEKLNLYGGVNYRSVEASYYNGNTLTNAFNRGLESYKIGIDYFFSKKDKSLFSAYAEISDTTYDNTEYSSSSQISSNEIVLGDGGNSYEIGGRYIYFSSKTHFYRAHLGYRLPGNSLSSEAPFNFDSVWSLNKWGILVGAGGIYSLGSSKYSDESSRPLQATRITGLYNSHDRSYIAGKGSLFYKPNPRWFFSFDASQIFQAKSYDEGLKVGLTLSYLVGGKSKEELSVIKENKAFKDYRVDAQVTKVSPRGKFVKVDAGLSSDIEKGQIFDFYQTDFYGTNTLVARGVVYESSLDSSIVKIVKLFEGKRVDTSMTARAK